MMNKLYFRKVFLNVSFIAGNGDTRKYAVFIYR